jgi:hypothetical protein
VSQAAVWSTAFSPIDECHSTEAKLALVIIGYTNAICRMNVSATEAKYPVDAFVLMTLFQLNNT